MGKLSPLLKKIQAFFTKENTPILSILLVAAFMRFYKVADYITFLGDEGRDVLVAKHILEGQFTLLGPTASVGGFFLGPIYYYLIAPFLWLFNYDPVGPAYMVSLFGVVTVFLIYKICQEWFDTKTALIASSLYAISPIVLRYSRSSWNPNLMPFFTLLTLYTLYHGVRKNSILLLFVVGILLGICLQLHYIEVFLGVIVAVYILVIKLYQHFVLKLRWKVVIQGVVAYYAIIFIGFVIGWLPLLAFEVRHRYCPATFTSFEIFERLFRNELQHCFPNINLLWGFIFSQEGTGAGHNYLTTVSDIFYRLFSRLITFYPFGDFVYRYNPFILGVWFVFTLLIALNAILHLVFQLVRNRFQTTAFSRYILLFLWLIVGVGLFGFYKKEIHDYYFEFMFPLPFILVGLVLTNGRKLFERLFKNTPIKHISTKFQIISLTIFITLAVLNLLGVPFQFTPNRQLEQTRNIAKFIYDQAGGKPFNFALISSGNSDHAYIYFFEVWGNNPVTIEDKEKDPMRKTVTDQLFIVCESLPCFPLQDYQWKIAFFGKNKEIVGEWDVRPYKVYKLKQINGDKEI